MDLNFIVDGERELYKMSPPPLPKNIRSREFLLDHISSSMRFFDPSKCIDPKVYLFLARILAKTQRIARSIS